MTRLEPLLEAEYPQLYRFALSITRHPTRAEDLTHDTVVRAIEKADQFNGDPSKVGAWLRRILHNLAVDTARRSARELLVDEVEHRWKDDDYTVNPEAFALKAQNTRELEDALTRLPFIYRTTVLLHDVEGWTVRQVAELQDIGVPAAKQRLRRGRMALVTALAEGAERRHLLKGVPMQCWDARQHISDYLDGTLATAIAQTIEAHLETCPTCPPLYAALVDTHRNIHELRDPDSVIPPELDRRLRHLLNQRRQA
ncbi:MAG: sigma-70 family RNA polymerase sigma factor [Acidimicrobiia bacterium]|nr:sigma-70 family RNA polymerase sigma factor [Acidimicrobiia bacterium]MBT8215840.1 sigma-70 family RNA polymerase sigma factor [Acidimicrobiia bacterium]NNF11001.1 sigma-70 family RNA polymerase sigma factor [Acidimicrobiia bacterium]NNL68853.1 sigma-70 family RNA polymerase sigma factor [Acidimicrobiia bacterium]